MKINIKLKTLEIMAMPIKETPVLRGEDARRFIAQNSIVVKETPDAMKRINNNYNRLKSIERF